MDPVDLAAHGKNCSDLLCVLSVCVNWRLANSRRKRPPQKNKRNCEVEGGRNGKLQRSEAYNKVRLSIEDDEVEGGRNGKLQRSEAYNKVRLSIEDDEDDMLNQLLDDLDDFKKDLIGPLENVTQNTNTKPLHPQEDFHLLHSDHVVAAPWTQLARNQQPSCTTGRVFDAGRYRPTTQNSSTFGVLPNKSTADCSDSDFLHFDLEQFIPMDPYIKPIDNQISGKKPSTSNAMETILCNRNLQDSREHAQLSGKRSRPKEHISKPNKLFGILSEMLGMFENPMSVDLEARYIRVLQKALIEIKGVMPVYTRKSAQEKV